jgi:hypothetical protein
LARESLMLTFLIPGSPGDTSVELVAVKRFYERKGL